LCCQVQVAGQISVHIQKPQTPPYPTLKKTDLCLLVPCLSRLCKSFVSACVMLQICALSICAFRNHTFINILTTLAPLSFTGAQSLQCRSQVPFCDSTTSLLLSLLQSVKNGVMKLQGHPHY
jgi:hypothetical protein